MDLSVEQMDLLRVVGELEVPGVSRPGTKDAGARLLEVWKERGGPHFWMASRPWHGTDPYAQELRDADLLDVGVGIARFRRWDEPAETVEQFWLALTDAGREVLAEAETATTQ